MLDKRNLIRQLEKEVNDTEKKVKYTNFYNTKAHITRFLIQNTIILDKALPYILASFIMFEVYSFFLNTPFLLDDIETIDPSSLKQDQIEEVISMTKEEIENTLIITNNETIQINISDLKEKLYNEEMFLIENTQDNKNYIKVVKESEVDNAFYTLSYLFSALSVGYILQILKSAILKNKIRDKLKEKENNHKPINKNDLEKLKKILELKKENLCLFGSSSKNNASDNDHPRILKKV